MLYGRRCIKSNDYCVQLGRVAPPFDEAANKTLLPMAMVCKYEKLILSLIFIYTIIRLLSALFRI